MEKFTPGSILETPCIHCGVDLKNLHPQANLYLHQIGECTFLKVPTIAELVIDTNTEKIDNTFSGHFNRLQKWNYENALKHGFEKVDINSDPLLACGKIALMHSELSEAVEALRMGNPPSEHIPAFSSVEEELADVVIRAMSFSKGNNLRLAEAIIAKMIFNQNRPYRHGNSRGNKKF